MRKVRFVGVATAGLLVGCYTLQPTGRVVPDVGRQVGLSLNDAGRAALGGTMGPEIDVIEGLLVEKDSADYLLAVSSVRLLRGGEQRWNGERIHIKSEYVTSAYERRFSRERTVIMGAIGLGVLAYIVTRSIIGSGIGDTMKPPVDTAHSLRRP